MQTLLLLATGMSGRFIKWWCACNLSSLPGGVSVHVDNSGFYDWRSQVMTFVCSGTTQKVYQRTCTTLSRPLGMCVDIGYVVVAVV